MKKKEFKSTTSILHKFQIVDHYLIFAYKKWRSSPQKPKYQINLCTNYRLTLKIPVEEVGGMTGHTITDSQAIPWATAVTGDAQRIRESENLEKFLFVLVQSHYIFNQGFVFWAITNV